MARPPPNCRTWKSNSDECEQRRERIDHVRSVDAHDETRIVDDRRVGCKCIVGKLMGAEDLVSDGRLFGRTAAQGQMNIAETMARRDGFVE